MVEDDLLHHQPDQPRLLRLRERLPERGEPGQRRPDLPGGDLRDRETLLFGGELLQPGLRGLHPAFGVLETAGDELGASGAGGDGVDQPSRLFLVPAKLTLQPVALFTDLRRALLSLGFPSGEDGLDQGLVGDELAEALQEEAFEDRGAEAANGAGVGALARDPSADIVEVLLLRAAERMIRAHRPVARPAAHQPLEDELVLARADAQVRSMGLGEELLRALEDGRVHDGGVLAVVELLAVEHLSDVGRVVEYSVLIREFVPSEPWRFGLYRSRRGENRDEVVAPLARWEDLSVTSRDETTPEIPQCLRKRPALLFAFLMICPWRGLPSVLRYLGSVFYGPSFF